MTEQIDFVSPNDSGEADDDSIQPYNNGDDWSATSLQRPVENLRVRTDTLRGEATSSRWTRMLDRATLMSVVGAAGITWGGTVANAGTGALVLGASTSLRVSPFVTPGSARAGAVNEGVGVVYPTRYAIAELTDGVDQEIRVLSAKQAWEGGNNITITITDVPSSGAISVDVTGNGAVTDPGVLPAADDVVVTYDSALGHSIDAVITAINANPAANALVTLTHIGTGSDADPMYDVTETPLSGGFDGVYHQISAVNLAAFFATTTENLLNEGDVLAIWYASDALRRQSTEESGNEDIPAASIVNLSAEPSKAPFSVVLGKVVEDAFVLATGAVLTKGATVLTLQGDETVRADLNRALASPPTAGANDYGDELVSVDPDAVPTIVPSPPLPSGTGIPLRDVLSAADARASAQDTTNAGFVKQHTRAELVANHRTVLWELDATVDTTAKRSLSDGDAFLFQSVHARVGYDDHFSSLLNLMGSAELHDGTANVVAGCGNGTHYYTITDADEVAAYAVEELSPDTYDTPATPINAGVTVTNAERISCDQNTVAIGTDDGQLVLYNNTLTTVIRALAEIGPASSPLIEDIAVRGAYTYVISRADVGAGDWRWYVYAIDNSDGTTTSSAQIHNASTGTSLIVFDASHDRVELVIFRSPYYEYETWVRNGVSFTNHANYRVGSTPVSTTVSHVRVDKDHTYLFGLNMSEQTVTAGGTAMITKMPRTRYATETGSAYEAAPTNFVGEVVIDGTTYDHVVLGAVDSQYVYGLVAATGTTTGGYLIAFDKKSMQPAAHLHIGATGYAGSDLGMYSNDEYLFMVSDKTGTGAVTLALYSPGNVGSWYQYTSVGGPPLWTNYVKCVT